MREKGGNRLVPGLKYMEDALKRMEHNTSYVSQSLPSDIRDDNLVFRYTKANNK